MTQETQATRDRRVIDGHNQANEKPPATGPWPQVGETWAPCAPWPEQGCPEGMYVHGYSEAMIGGTAGWICAFLGYTDISMDLRPMSLAGATVAAWEYRYGLAKFTARGSEEPIDKLVIGAVHEPGRYGTGEVIIEAVGATTVFARRPGGPQVTVWLSDMLRGWVRVGEVPPPLAEVCL